VTFFPRYLDLIKLDKISIKLEFLQEENVATNSKAVEVEEEDVLMATGVIVRRRKLLILALSPAIIYTRIWLTIIFGATASIIRTPLITGILLLLQDTILQDAEEDVDVEMEEAEVEDQEDTILITTVILPIILHLVLQQHLKSNMLMKEVVILPIWQMRTSILIMRIIKVMCMRHILLIWSE
jgi:hypothetical protein